MQLKALFGRTASTDTMTEQSIVAGLRRGTIEGFVLNATGIGMISLMHFVLGRMLGADDYGIVTYTITLATVLAAIVPLGWATALTRFVAQYRSQQKWELLSGVLLRAHQITLVCAILASLALWVASLVLPLSAELMTSFRFGAVLLPLIALVGLRTRAFQGFRRIGASITLEHVILPALVLGGALIFGARDAVDTLSLYTGAAILVLLLGSVWLWRTIPAQARATRPEMLTRTWAWTALPMVLSGLGPLILGRVDLLMIGYFLDPRAAGLYAAASRVARLNAFTLGAINTIAPPMLAATFSSGRPDQFKLILRRAMLWSILGSLPLFVIMLLWPEVLLRLFGRDFTQAAFLLQILAVGQFVNAATGPVGHALLMTGRERTYALIMFVAVVANLVGNWQLIPLWGATGAAVVSAATIAFCNGAMWFQIWRTSPANSEVRFAPEKV